MKPLISIGIPTYEMSGYGVYYLNELLNSINIQTFNDIFLFYFSVKIINR